MRNILNTLGLVLLMFIGIMSVCAFSVYESERAIVFRLGQLKAQKADGSSCELRALDKKVIKGDCQPVVLQPGLHFKLPIIDTVRPLDARLLMLVIASERIPTQEKKDVIVDLFVKWSIKDFGLFYIRTNGSQSGAELLLRQKVIDGLRAAFGKRTIKDLVAGREAVMESVKQETEFNALGLGIEVADVRIKRIDFPEEVSEAVYKRMRTERESAAVQLRANGEAKADMLRAAAEKEKRVILAEARKNAERIRGEGDVIASRTYAQVYSQAPEFFDFYRSIEAYKKSFKSLDDILVIEPSADFFKYFRSKAKKELPK